MEREGISVGMRSGYGEGRDKCGIHDDLELAIITMMTSNVIAEFFFMQVRRAQEVFRTKVLSQERQFRLVRMSGEFRRY